MNQWPWPTNSTIDCDCARNHNRVRLLATNCDTNDNVTEFVNGNYAMVWCHNCRNRVAVVVQDHNLNTNLAQRRDAIENCSAKMKSILSFGKTSTFRGQYCKLLLTNPNGNWYIPSDRHCHQYSRYPSLKTASNYCCRRPLHLAVHSIRHLNCPCRSKCSVTLFLDIFSLPFLTFTIFQICVFSFTFHPVRLAQCNRFALISNSIWNLIKIHFSILKIHWNMRSLLQQKMKKQKTI